ncbi:MAG: hypothetical protein U0457_12755 [Candidatus Sericytochromatia bacterium]
MGNVPFWVYKLVAVIIKKGGYTLLTVVSALVIQGVLKSSNDVMSFINKKEEI